MSGCCFVRFLAVAVALKGKLQKVPLFDAPEVQALKLHHFIGRMKGIQGHQNSCYLDATLFAMFGVTSRFDEVIYEHPIDDTAMGVLETMCEEIIFPLRRYVQSVVITLFLQGLVFHPHGFDVMLAHITHTVWSVLTVYNCGVY